METNSFIADITRSEGASSFKVDRLITEGTYAPAGDLLDPSVVYADRDALQMVIAGKLCVEFSGVRVRIEDTH
jgi:hypothetical protein